MAAGNVLKRFNAPAASARGLAGYGEEEFEELIESLNSGFRVSVAPCLLTLLANGELKVVFHPKYSQCISM